MDISSIMDDPPSPPQRSSGAYANSSTRQSMVNSETDSHTYILDPENSLNSPAFVLPPIAAQYMRDGNEEHAGDWLRNEERQPTTLSSPERRRYSGRRKETKRERYKDYGDNLIFQEKVTWTKEKETILMGPFDYIDGQPGKDIRSQLIAAFNAWLRVPTESLAVITKVVGMLHNASLLVDDVEDFSLLRRGVPVAHSIFGAAQTINSANYVYFRALQELQKLRNPLALQIYTEELLNLHRGQGMDLFWRDSLVCPTEDDYLEMVNNKTGGLFRLAVKLMQAESSSDRDCVPLVNTIGLLFQILDDYRNLCSASYTTNKGLAEDLTEGKFSFPVIHAIRSDPSNRVILNILKQKPKDEQVKKYAVEYMEKMGSFAYARTRLRELTEKAVGLVESMEIGEGVRGVGNGVKAILDKMRVEEPPAAAAAAIGSGGGNGGRVNSTASSATTEGFHER